MANYQITGTNKAGKPIKIDVDAANAKEAMSEAAGMGIDVAEVKLAEKTAPAQDQNKTSGLNQILRLVLILIIGLCVTGGIMKAHRQDADLIAGLVLGLVWAILPGALLALLYVKRVF